MFGLGLGLIGLEQAKNEYRNRHFGLLGQASGLGNMYSTTSIAQIMGMDTGSYETKPPSHAIEKAYSCSFSGLRDHIDNWVNK